MNKYAQDMGATIVSEEELKQMSGDELIGIIKAQRFEIKEKNLLIQELRDTIDNQRETIEQLENIRKKGMKATKDVKQFVYDELVDRNVSGATETHCKIMDLLNILNKGSDE